MRLASVFRLCVLWGFVAVATSVTKAARRKVASRRSRQAFEAEPVEGVWSSWGEWSECSQTCSVGVNQRSRKCLPPPLPQTPPLSLSPPNWAGYLPAASPVNPFYPPRYPGQHPPYRSASSNPNPGLPLYRSAPAGGEEPPVPAQGSRSLPFYRSESPPAGRVPASGYRAPYYTPPQGYNQPGRIVRRPTNPEARAGGGGSRRSVSGSREGLPSRRSSSIRPGQFGYGKVPFSLPLHRADRQARHTVNGTDEDGAENVREDEKSTADEEEEEEDGQREIGAAAERPRQHAGRPPHPELRRSRVQSQQPFQRSSLPSVFISRRRFDWNTVTAPPPPPPALTRQRSPPPFSSPLHRPSRDREPRPDFNPQPPPPPAGNAYPLQHPHPPHPGVQPGRHGGGGGAFRVFRCSGPEKEYRRCFSQVCAGSASDSRAEQCAAFNAQEFMGRLYSWEPFTEVGADKQCELTCRPAGYRFYVRQAERARDGTPCFNASANDVCVEGRCLTEGCDGTLGSGAAIDRCGVCGGQGASCRRVTGSFQNTSVPLGYHKILDVPVGATFINITERRASPNYLAMRSGTGASVVNGRWAVDPPGEYQAGGTSFTYSRPRAQPDGEDERGESLRARGPTTTQLQLYIIFHKDNPGIDYEFYVPVETREGEREAPREREPARAPLRGPLAVSVEEPPPISGPSLPSSSSSSSSTSVFSPPSFDRWPPERTRPRGLGPNRNARIPPRTDLPPDTQLPFVWRKGGLTECSASCGRGSQHRVILCVNRHTDEEVAETKCDSAAKPAAEEESCNTQLCPPFWEASAWSECSVSCGPGVQQRQLQCRQSFGMRSTMVHPQHCAHLTQPESTQACELQLCSHWEVSSNWSTCSVDCGLGRRTRSVRCVSDQGGVVSDNECNSRLRPQGSEECNMGPCVTNWYFTDWSNTCSAQCGPGVQKREVVCLTRGGVRDGGEGGDCVAEKPMELKACNRGPCVPTVLWYSSSWSECNVPCGDGTQRRDIVCVKKLGSNFTVASDSECAHLERPAAVQECRMGECRPRWFTTEWSACSRSCGRGLQIREVRCLTPEKTHSQACDLSAKPEQEQICNATPCGPQVADKNCRDRRDNCMMVVQARMCVYSYYKTACCASCTQSAQRAKRH
ncbi:thrombospondin type-1 domain-containing protein 4 isoform X2 [Kryptolebias marmoratus]|uniref:PLAC domain-containing protein n=1 Tax=Kryptolebias marmoratus TaxID=37003 RepID=A0A3Q3EI69_KRYMA|nr:thrombospondin type-1 domain-containing protein 4 isoform X1 [Kryptolebias marmoratus]XP_037836114.1 thrombospondin type-1 domain-containing protein 4 isoform X2 [Kryptolebias marmoratus]